MPAANTLPPWSYTAGQQCRSGIMASSCFPSSLLWGVPTPGEPLSALGVPATQPQANLQGWEGCQPQASGQPREAFLSLESWADVKSSQEYLAETNLQSGLMKGGEQGHFPVELRLSKKGKDLVSGRVQG